MSRQFACTLLLLLRVAFAEEPDLYPWPHASTDATVLTRFAPPAGFHRLPATAGSFAEWLRGLPLQADGALVHLYDGSLKSRQDGVAAVLDVDVGGSDLQQCADAVIRLRAEYLRVAGLDRQIAFHFTNGDLARWQEWREGIRPEVRGSHVAWHRSAAPDSSYAAFRSYLNSLFTFAGTTSLEAELIRVPDPAQVQSGDVFIQGGSPGHAVIVVDVAENDSGQQAFLIAQGYMPAQEIHVLRNPQFAGNDWYFAQSTGVLVTPEWTFRFEQLRRFPTR